MPQDWRTVVLNAGIVVWFWSLWKHPFWRGGPPGDK